MEAQRLHRGRLIDHLQLVVKDLAATRRFYEAVFKVLGVPIGGEGAGGRNFDDALARARMAQAFGRLIRRADDKGVFVMLDAAAPTRLFASLPPGTEVQRMGLADAVELVGGFLG